MSPGSVLEDRRDGEETARAPPPHPPGAFPLPSPVNGPSTHPPLALALRERVNDLVRPMTLRLRIGTWNVAARAGTENDLAAWFSGRDEDSKRPTAAQAEGNSDGQIDKPTGKTQNVQDPAIADMYVLGLQEIVDISSPTETLRPYVDPAPAKRWREAALNALPPGYVVVAEQQLIGLLLIIIASSTVSPTISSVDSTMVGTGLMGYVGNKGAVAIRLVLGETTRLVFVNSHLAAGTEKGSVERRNWDASQVVARAKFEPVESGPGIDDLGEESIGQEDFAFWFGDLNYRLESIPGDDVRRLLRLHADANEASAQAAQDDSEESDRSKVSSNGTSSDKLADDDSSIHSTEDPASLQATLSSLLAHDELRAQIRDHKAFFDGWQEGQVRFFPTYKYDVGSVSMFDSSEKKRSPSWCDRILYRSRKRYLAHLDRIKSEEETRRRDEEMRSRGLEGSHEDVVFEYDPENDAAEDEYDEQNDISDPKSQDKLDASHVNSAQEERLLLQSYTSHQGVLSSDHKPLDAVFELRYDAIDPVAKATVQQELAREIDKTENELRPGVTIVVEGSDDYEDEHGSVNFGNVRFGVSTTRTVTVANTSRVLAHLGFVELHEDRSSPPWLSIHALDQDGRQVAKPFSEQKLEPGDTVHLELTLRVSDIEAVRKLNSEKEKLEDVLVLRVQGGRDHFLPVNAHWLKTSFGMSLDELVRFRNGDDSVIEAPSSAKLSAPREIFDLAKALEDSLDTTLPRAPASPKRSSSESQEPWETLGWPFAPESWAADSLVREDCANHIRESLDLDKPLSLDEDLSASTKVEAIAETLSVFVDSIDGGIIDSPTWESLSKVLSDHEKLRQPLSDEEQRSHILDVLSSSPARSVCFTFLAFTLARVANRLVAMSSAPATPTSPRSGNALLKRARGISQDPVMGRKIEIEQKYASIFAKAIFKPATNEAKAKEKRAAQDKQRGMLLLFLRSARENDL